MKNHNTKTKKSIEFCADDENELDSFKRSNHCLRAYTSYPTCEREITQGDFSTLRHHYQLIVVPETRLFKIWLCCVSLLIEFYREIFYCAVRSEVCLEIILEGLERGGVAVVIICWLNYFLLLWSALKLTKCIKSFNYWDSATN